MTEPRPIDAIAKRPKQRRRTLAVIAGASALVLLIAAVVVWQIWPAATKPAPSANSTPTATPTPSPTPEPMAEVELPAWDEFDWWDAEQSNDDVIFRASTDAHDGVYSVSIESGLDFAAGENAQLRQELSVVGGRAYDITFWVKSVDATDRAVEVSPSVDGSTRIAVPSGTYDWTEMNYQYVVPEGENHIQLRIIAQGQTGTTWIDSLTISPGGKAQSDQMQNADFESNSSAIVVTNPSLLFPEGQVEIDFMTRIEPEATFSWEARDLAGNVAAAGTTAISDHRGVADLSVLPRGMYSFAFAGSIGGRDVARDTKIAVLGPDIAAAPSSVSPFGVFVHYLGGEPRLTNLIVSLATAGVKHARVEMTWPAIEQEQGKYKYPDPIDSTIKKMEEVGIDPLVVPVYGNQYYDGGLTPSSEVGLAAYAKFSANVVDHYSSVGQSIEVYNEYDHIFNSGLCGRTVACYLDMLSNTAEAVKAETPDAIIAAPGNAGMGLKLDALQQFMDAGGLQYTDVVSAHPYTQPHPPEELIPDMDALGQMIKDANGGVSKPIWFTEMGWTSVPAGVTEEVQADYLVRMLALGLGHGVERIYWFEAADLSQNGENGELNFGLFNPPQSLLPFAHSPKPAAVAQAVMAREIDGQRFVAQDNAGANGYSYVFQGGQGPDTRVMWATGGGQSVTIMSTTAVEITNLSGQVSTLEPVDGAVTLALTGSPVFVSGSISSVMGG